MIKLHVSASEKVGTPNYSSLGAQCGLEIELDTRLLAEPEKLRDAILGYQQLCTAAMRDHLRQLGSAPTNGKAPVAAAPSHQQPSSNGKAHQREPEPDFTEYDQTNEEDDADDAPPTTGRELLGWARKQPEDAFGWLVKTGKKLRFPKRILDWSQSEVTRAYDAYHNAHGN
jgi:hypothetical protein